MFMENGLEVKKEDQREDIWNKWGKIQRGIISEELLLQGAENYPKMA